MSDVLQVNCVCGETIELPSDLKGSQHAHCPHCGSYYGKFNREIDLLIFRPSKNQVKSLIRHRDEWSNHFAHRECEDDER